MIHNSITALGQVEVLLHDLNGKLKERRDIKNIVVTVGKSLIASRLIGTGEAVPSRMAVGTSNTATDVNQTNLVAEVIRVALATPVRTNNTITFAATYDAGVATGTLQEAGIFNNTTGGTMLCRTVFSPVIKEATDVLTINWNVTIS